MYKKFDDEAVTKILEAGIDEFAEHGLDKTKIATIAKRAGVSVGVIYKYYEDKDAFFLACVEHSLGLLEQAMQSVISEEDDILLCIEHLVEHLVEGAEAHQNYYAMYNEITSGSCQKYAKQLANEIEGKTSSIYAALLEKAQKEKKVKYQGNPQMFAFFFDNILMMLQFSFSGEYYRERFKIFCGADIAEDKKRLKDEFMIFIRSTLGV